MKARWIPMLAALVAGEARAAWVQEPGAHYLKLSDQVLIGDRVFSSKGDQLQLPASYHDHSLRLYFEYGIDPGLTVIVRGTPLGIASYDGEVTAYSGLMMVGLRAALLKGIAFELSYGWAPPLGDAPLAEGEVGGRRFVYRPSFEQHVGQAEIQLGWAGPILWCKVGIGLSMSTGEDISPSGEGSFRVGGLTTFGLEGDVGIVGHAPFRDPRVIDVTGVGDTRYVGLGIGLGYWLTDGFGLRLDVGFAPFAESNAATPSISLGVQSR